MRRIQTSLADEEVENGKRVKRQKQENAIESVKGMQEVEVVKDVKG